MRPQPYSAAIAPSETPAAHCAGIGKRASGFLMAHAASNQASVAGRAAPVSTAICSSQSQGVAATNIAPTATTACTNNTARSTTPTLQVSNTRSRGKVSAGMLESRSVPPTVCISW